MWIDNSVRFRPSAPTWLLGRHAGSPKPRSKERPDCLPMRQVGGCSTVSCCPRRDSRTSARKLPTCRWDASFTHHHFLHSPWQWSRARGGEKLPQEEWLGWEKKHAVENGGVRDVIQDSKRERCRPCLWVCSFHPHSMPLHSPSISFLRGPELTHNHRASSPLHLCGLLLSSGPFPTPSHPIVHGSLAAPDAAPAPHRSCPLLPGCRAGGGRPRWSRDPQCTPSPCYHQTNKCNTKGSPDRRARINSRLHPSYSCLALPRGNVY